MTQREAQALKMKRAELVRRLERTGPDNERIRDCLVEWAENRAAYFNIDSRQNTLLTQAGIAKEYPQTEAWIEGFDDGIVRFFGLTDDDIHRRVAYANDLSPEQLDRLMEQEPDAAERLWGIRVDVID